MTIRRHFISANWKMNKTVSDAEDFLNKFLPQVKDINDRDIIIAPSFVALSSISEKLKGTNVLLSAQNVFYEEKGAFTGEVSPIMLKDIGCHFVIIGHSERRQYFKETDETVNKKIRISLKSNLKVIFCIGESLNEKTEGKTFDVLKTQLRKGLIGIEDIKDIVVAYEPVWAIGTGITATPTQAEESHKFIRDELIGLYGKIADSVRIIYGGSVTPENVNSLTSCPNVDGALVGGASLNPENFAKIVKATKGG